LNEKRHLKTKFTVQSRMYSAILKVTKKQQQKQVARSVCRLCL